jgi:translation initiation factor 2-alpha kinase 4
MERIEKEKNKARRRAMSDVTERPAQGITIEKFDDTIEIDGIPFDTVKLFHGRSREFNLTSTSCLGSCSHMHKNVSVLHTPLSLSVMVDSPSCVLLNCTP